MLDDELELLQNIYIDELVISRDIGSPTPVSVTIHVHPATCDNSDEQYVRITATFRLPPEYPETLPICELSSPRGLADEELSLLKAQVDSLLVNNAGSPVLHDAIELIRGVLTDSNVPHGCCSICLTGFDQPLAIVKTDCYHYFHAPCLARYVLHWREEQTDDRCTALQQGNSAAATTTKSCGAGKEYPCPVCRKPTRSGGSSISSLAGQWPLAELAAAYDEGDAQSTYVPTADDLGRRAQMRSLYERQRQKGGIIDLEAERARLQLPPPLPPPPQPPANTVQLEGDTSAGQTAMPTLCTASATAMDDHVPASTGGAATAALPVATAAEAAPAVGRDRPPAQANVRGSGARNISRRHPSGGAAATGRPARPPGASGRLHHASGSAASTTAAGGARSTDDGSGRSSRGGRQLS